MDPLLLVSALLIAALLALVLVVRYYQERVARTETAVEEAHAARRRAADAQGLAVERLAPILARYPFDARGFRFIGAPVDGVQFEADRVVFVQFTGAGRAPPDERVREAVRAGRVEWREVALDGERAPQEDLS